MRYVIQKSLPAIALAGCALLVGCQNEGMSNAHRLVDATEELRDQFKSVVDAPSAKAATAEIEPAYKEFLAAFDAVIEYEKEHGQTRGLKSTINRLMADIQRLQAELAEEVERVENLKGLPIEFWDVVRLYSGRVMTTVLKTVEANGQALDSTIVDFVNTVAEFYEQHGPPKVLEITVEDPTPEGMELIAAALAKHAPQAQHKEMANPEEINEMLMVAAPVDDFDALVKKIDFAEVVEHDKARGHLLLRCLPPSNEELAVADEVEVDPEQERRRLEQEAEARAEHERIMVEAQRQREEMEKKFREPQPSDPDYHERLVELLVDEHAPHHDTAVKTLLQLRPSDIPDKQTRGKIARGFRELAMNSTFKREEAARGLVIWGGKYAVPILVEMLDDGRHHENAAVLDALAEVPTPEGATAAARLLGDFFNKEQAIACLREMGSVAEDAVMQVAPNDDPEVSLTAVTLLGEVGTPKSYPLLRKASKSKNVEVKQAAYTAIRSIRSREQTATKRKN